MLIAFPLTRPVQQHTEKPPLSLWFLQREKEALT